MQAITFNAQRRRLTRIVATMDSIKKEWTHIAIQETARKDNADTKWIAKMQATSQGHAIITNNVAKWDTTTIIHAECYIRMQNIIITNRRHYVPDHRVQHGWLLLAVHQLPHA